MMRDFLLALGFFTRIPVPDHPNFTEAALQRSAVYFPLVGTLVGGIIAAAFLLAHSFWSTPLAVVIALAVGFLATGGFHEDGWADTFDGLGGAFGREKKLAIMTDSRLGTYGSLALWALLMLKTFTLIELLPAAGILVFLLIHTLSRWASMSAMVWLSYVRVAPSKAKPVVQQLSFARWLAAGLFILPWLILLANNLRGINALILCASLLATSLIVTLIWHFILNRQLGGYTGDTLGASQQLNEVCLMLVWLTLV